jgi:hypothetical protein
MFVWETISEKGDRHYCVDACFIEIKITSSMEPSNLRPGNRLYANDDCLDTTIISFAMPCAWLYMDKM